MSRRVVWEGEVNGKRFRLLSSEGAHGGPAVEYADGKDAMGQWRWIEPPLTLTTPYYMAHLAWYAMTNGGRAATPEGTPR